MNNVVHSCPKANSPQSHREHRGFLFFYPSASGSESLRLGEEKTMGKMTLPCGAGMRAGIQWINTVFPLPHRADGFRLPSFHGKRKDNFISVYSVTRETFA